MSDPDLFTFGSRRPRLLPDSFGGFSPPNPPKPIDTMFSFMLAPSSGKFHYVEAESLPPVLLSLGGESALPTHSPFSCDKCGMNPIVGVRFSCLHCQNYDLCGACETGDPRTFHDRHHIFIKLREPTDLDRGRFGLPWKMLTRQ